MPLEGKLIMTDPTPAPGAQAEPTTAPGAPTTTPPVGPNPNEPVDVAALPANVQQLISSLRGEATKARTQAKATAAEQARNEVLQQISGALGLTDTPNDPKALAEQLTSAQDAAADAQLENTVYRRANTLGVNGDKLLDSMAFRKAVDDLPDDGFDQALETLINQWADKDPSLRTGGQQTNSRRPVENLRSGALPASAQDAADGNAWLRNLRR